MRIIHSVFTVVLAVCASTAATTAQVTPRVLAASTDEKIVIYVGGYTRDEGWVNGTATGVHAFQFDTRNGALSQVNAKAFGINPTFVTGTTTNGRRVIYATNEVVDPSVLKPGKETGYVYAIAVDGKGQMTELNRVESGGGNSNHVSLSPDEKFLTVSNYGGAYGSVSIFPVNANGSLQPATDYHEYTQGSGVVPDRQPSSHMHSMNWLGKGSLGVIGADLGNDRLTQYTFDEKTGKLNPNAATPFLVRGPGDGPRHISIHPTKKWAYLSNEMGNTVSVFNVNFAAGTLTSNSVQTISTLPAGFTGSSTAAEVRVSDCGRFVYVSNRGHDSIAIYKIGTNGQLTSIGFEPTRGRTPRNFNFYKNYLIVANQDSSNLQVFRINEATGLLTYANQSATVGTPTVVYIPRYQ